MTPLGRFLVKAGPRPADPNACQIWQGQLHPWGYGRFFMDGKHYNAHRAAYLLFVSEDIDGLHIDHLCRNRACVNPMHLEAVTLKENVLRGVGGGAKNARATHCKRGHEFTPENTQRRADGSRRCVACQRARWQAIKAQQPPKPRRVAQHGTNTKYTKGCRCDDCRTAHTAYNREFRMRRSREHHELQEAA